MRSLWAYRIKCIATRTSPNNVECTFWGRWSKRNDKLTHFHQNGSLPSWMQFLTKSRGFISRKDGSENITYNIWKPPKNSKPKIVYLSWSARELDRIEQWCGKLNSRVRYRSHEWNPRINQSSNQVTKGTEQISTLTKAHPICAAESVWVRSRDTASFETCAIVQLSLERPDACLLRWTTSPELNSAFPDTLRFEVLNLTQDLIGFLSGLAIFIQNLVRHHLY